MMKSVIFLSLILLPLLSVVSTAEAIRLRGWQPIKDLTDPDVVVTAEFAVDVYNEQSKQNLVYEQVVEGKKEVVAGLKYDLIILASNGESKANNGESKKYEAVVWNKLPSGVGNLISFKAV